MEYIASQKKLTELLAQHGFNIKKSFGQNFLIDKNILKKIVVTSGITKDVIALEIGPGVGSLTQFLSVAAKAVYCFEIDHKLEALLEDTLESCENTTVIFSDFLKQDLAAWYEPLKGEEIKVIANLPYYITTPIIEKLIIWYVTEQPNLTSATVMMQKEVAQRLAASPNSKEYGSLSIFIQLFADVKVAFTVPKTVFIPAPRIDSAIVQLTFKKKNQFESYEAAEQFMQFVRLCFATRRKTLVNNLKQSYETTAIVEALAAENMKEQIRAEQLDVEQFMKLFSRLANK